MEVSCFAACGPSGKQEENLPYSIFERRKATFYPIGREKEREKGKKFQMKKRGVRPCFDKSCG